MAQAAAIPVAEILIGIGRRIIVPILVYMGEKAVDAAKEWVKDIMKAGVRNAGYEAVKSPLSKLITDVIRSNFFYQTDKTTDQPNPGFLIDYNTFEEVVGKTLQATIVAQGFIGEDASEVILEILQEGITNSIQYGLAGAWALTTAYSIGFGMPQQLFLVGEDYMSPKARANLDLMTGQIMHNLVAQEFVRITQDYESIMGGRLARRLLYGLEFSSAPYSVMAGEALETARSAINHTISMIWEAVSALNRRVSDILWALEAAYSDYQSGLLMENEFVMIAMSLNNQLDAIESALSELEQAVNSMPDNISSDLLATLASNVRNAVSKFIDNVKNSWFSDAMAQFGDYVNVVKTARSTVPSNIKYRLEMADKNITV